jgi:anti-anti-sigma factor
MVSRRELKYERIDKTDPQHSIFRVSGDLTDSRESYVLLEEIRKTLQGGCPLVLINLMQLGFISSSGVGILAASYTSARNAGGRLCIIGVSERGRILLEIVGLWTVIEHFDREEEALTGAKA